MASAASAAVSLAWPYTSCSVPSICLALPWTCVFTSPVARPNPSSTCPPTFLAIPPRRSSFMGVVLLRFEVKPAAAGIRSSSASLLSSRGASELTAAILFIAAALRLAAARPFHANGGGENAEGEQRNERAPTDRAAGLNRTGNQLRVEPNGLFARGEGHLGPFNSPAP